MKIFIILLLLLPITLAQEFDSYNLEISLEPSGLAHEKIESSFTINQDSNSILFSLDQEIQNVNSNFDSSLTNEGILINKNIKANEKNTIILEFDTKDLIKQSGKNFIFSLDFSIPFNSKNTQIKLNLPEGFILADVESPVSPKPPKIETDGKVISLIWSNINQGSFIVIYKRGFTSKSESLLPFYLIFGLIIFILISIITILIQKRKTKDFLSSTLSENENVILNLIRKEKDITQKKIRQLTGFSKSKLSKIVRRLEEKNILKRKPFFKTHKFELPKRLK